MAFTRMGHTSLGSKDTDEVIGLGFRSGSCKSCKVPIFFMTRGSPVGVHWWSPASLSRSVPIQLTTTPWGPEEILETVIQIPYSFAIWL